MTDSQEMCLLELTTTIAAWMSTLDHGSEFHIAIIDGINHQPHDLESSKKHEMICLIY